jgi:hypothetical protein
VEDSPARWKGNRLGLARESRTTSRLASLGPCSRRRGAKDLPPAPHCTIGELCKLKNLLGWGQLSGSSARRRPVLGGGGSGPTSARQRRRRWRQASAPRWREEGPSEAKSVRRSGFASKARAIPFHRLSYPPPLDPNERHQGNYDRGAVFFITADDVNLKML